MLMPILCLLLLQDQDTPTIWRDLQPCEPQIGLERSSGPSHHGHHLFTFSSSGRHASAMHTSSSCHDSNSFPEAICLLAGLRKWLYCPCSNWSSSISLSQYLKVYQNFKMTVLIRFNSFEQFHFKVRTMNSMWDGRRTRQGACSLD